MGRTACTEPQCLYSRSILLLPLCAVRPVQSLSACTVDLYFYFSYVPYGLYRASVPVQYSYTSTPPMGRTACTEPQCLYMGPLYIYVYSYKYASLKMYNSVSLCTFSSDMSPEVTIENVTLVYTSRGDTIHKRKIQEPVILPSIYERCYLPKVIYNLP